MKKISTPELEKPKMVSMRLSPQCIDFLAQNFDNPSNGATQIIETAAMLADDSAITALADFISGLIHSIKTFGALYRQALMDLRGRFSRNELMFLVDLRISTILTPGISSNMLANDSREVIALDGKGEYFEIADTDDFVGRLEDLNPTEAAALEIWLKGATEGDTDKIIAQLT